MRTELFRKCCVRGVPTTIIYENNVEMERVVGFEDVSFEKRFNIYIEPK